MSGQWAQVSLPDGTLRQDWVPDEQPPAPGGSAGRWHVVESGPGEPTRWEWHPSPQQSPLTVDLSQTADRASDRLPDAADDRRAALFVGAIWGAFVALLPGIRIPLVTTWEKVSEDGSAGLAVLLALLVAVYVLAAAGIAWAFAQAFDRRPATPPSAPYAG